MVQAQLLPDVLRSSLFLLLRSTDLAFKFSRFYDLGVRLFGPFSLSFPLCVHSRGEVILTCSFARQNDYRLVFLGSWMVKASWALIEDDKNQLLPRWCHLGKNWGDRLYTKQNIYNRYNVLYNGGQVIMTFLSLFTSILNNFNKRTALL